MALQQLWDGYVHCERSPVSLRSFVINAEYIDVAGSLNETQQDFLDMSIKMTRPASAMRLWFLM
jgi:hypothetical protein